MTSSEGPLFGLASSLPNSKSTTVVDYLCYSENPKLGRRLDIAVLDVELELKHSVPA